MQTSAKIIVWVIHIPSSEAQVSSWAWPRLHHRPFTKQFWQIRPHFYVPGNHHPLEYTQGYGRYTLQVGAQPGWACCNPLLLDAHHSQILWALTMEMVISTPSVLSSLWALLLVQRLVMVVYIVILEISNQSKSRLCKGIDLPIFRSSIVLAWTARVRPRGSAGQVISVNNKWDCE